MATRENHAGDTNLQNRCSTIDSWCKPPLQVVKINSDAAVKEEVSAMGIVAKDHRGEVLQIKASFLRVNLPELAKAYGILQGLITAKKEGWQRVCCESDAKNVVMVLHHSSTIGHHWAAKGVIKDKEEITPKLSRSLLLLDTQKKTTLLLTLSVTGACITIVMAFYL